MKVEGKIGIYKRKIKKIFKIAEKVLKEDFSNVLVSGNSSFTIFCAYS